MRGIYISIDRYIGIGSEVCGLSPQDALRRIGKCGLARLVDGCGWLVDWVRAVDGSEQAVSG